MQIKQYQTTKYIMGNGALREVQRWKDKKIGLVVDENVLKALQLETKLFDELLKDCDYEVLCNMPQEPTTELLEPEIAANQNPQCNSQAGTAPRPPCQCQLGALVFHGYA